MAGRKPSIDVTWRRLEKWFAVHLPEQLVALNRGASETALRRFEKQIGRALPKDLRQSFLLHNGESAKKVCVGCVYGLDLLTLDESLRAWETWDDITPIPEIDEEASSIPKGHVQNLHFHPGWIPLTHDGSGNHIAADLAPAEKGVVGQIIVFGRDGLRHYVAARSFAEFLRMIADQLAAKNFEIGRYGDRTLVGDIPMIEFNVQTPKVRHFHEAIARRFNIAKYGDA